jgi:serine/threonine protein kinase
MDLKKSPETRRTSQSFKFRLPCQSKWLEIRKQLTIEHPVLHGILIEQNKDVVVKYGLVDLINKDYRISNELINHYVPNIIKYYCSFVCKDTLEHIPQQKYLCHPNGAENIGYLVMPYYSLGDLHNHCWKRETLNELKNILTQACFAVLYAFETCGFVHNDLHLFNILIRKTKKSSLHYGDVRLAIGTYYVIIMDFEKSTLQVESPRDAYFTIRNILNNATSLRKSNLALEVNVSLINRWMSGNTPITNHTYANVKDIIDTISILYEKDKVPPNPFK